MHSMAEMVERNKVQANDNQTWQVPWHHGKQHLRCTQSALGKHDVTQGYDTDAKDIEPNMADHDVCHGRIEIRIQ